MNLDEVSCRPAEVVDLPGVAELLLRSRAHAAPAMPPVPEEAHDVVRRDVAGWDLGRRETWLAEATDGTLAGFAVMHRDWLESLYVDPDHQRGGVGTLLLDLARGLRPAGFGLWVFATNTPARAFYARAGLVELETTDGSHNPEGWPDVRMAWPGADPLGFWRRAIDEVDDELGDLLARRAALTRAAQAPKGAGGATRDDDREAEVVRRVAARAPVLGAARVARIMDVVITESLDLLGPSAAPGGGHAVGPGDGPGVGGRGHPRVDHGTGRTPE